MMGMISTVIIALIIGFLFIIGTRKIVRKFTKGESDCCGSGGCGRCGGHCSSEVKKF